MEQKPTVHAVALPAPFHDVRTVCGLSAHEAGSDEIALVKEAVTCPMCLVLIGDRKITDELRNRDWTEGLPVVSLEENPNGPPVFKIAHHLAAIMGQIFLDTLKSIGATNYLEFSMISAKTREEIIVTIQRRAGMSPGEKNRKLTDLLARCLPWLSCGKDAAHVCDRTDDLETLMKEIGAAVQPPPAP